jgi:hypothetical protein
VPKYTPTGKRLAGGVGCAGRFGHGRVDRGHQPFRGVLLGHRAQGLEQALPFLELGTRRRIGGQPPFELARLGVAGFAVEDGVDQLGERGVLQGHLTSNP